MFEMTVCIVLAGTKGKKKHVCETCDWSCCSKSNLVRHSKRHASSTCVCQVCDKRFFRRPWTSLPHGGGPYGYPTQGLLAQLQKDPLPRMNYISNLCAWRDHHLLCVKHRIEKWNHFYELILMGKHLFQQNYKQFGTVICEINLYLE